MKPKRIVILASFRIFPAETGGHLRTAVVAKVLARLGHDVLVYSMAGRRADYATPDRAAGYRVDQIEDNLREEIHLGLGSGIAQAATRRLRLARIWVLLLLRFGLLPRRMKMALESADICISDMPWSLPPRGFETTKPWLLLSHNLEHRLLEQGRPLERPFSGWLKRIEAKVPQRYVGVLTCADDDHQFFEKHDPEKRCVLSPVGCAVDPLSYQQEAGVRESTRRELGVADDDTMFVFSGSSFQPNVDAFEWLQKFSKDHADFLQREKIRFVVVGTISARAWKSGALIVTGRVEEINPYFMAADIGLNPVVWGSGANVKMFEYIAARLPLMSTQFGVRGIKLEAGTDFHLFDRDHFEQRLIDLRRALPDRAARLAFAESVWNRHKQIIDIHQVLENALEDLHLFDS